MWPRVVIQVFCGLLDLPLIFIVPIATLVNRAVLNSATAGTFYVMVVIVVWQFLFIPLLASAMVVKIFPILRHLLAFASIPLAISGHLFLRLTASVWAGMEPTEAHAMKVDFCHNWPATLELTEEAPVEQVSAAS